MNSGDLLRGAKAETRGDTLIVKLPIVQLILILGVGISVLAGVWLATRDLGRDVETLSNAVTKLTGVVVRLDERLDDHEVRIRLIEHENERNSGP